MQAGRRVTFPAPPSGTSGEKWTCASVSDAVDQRRRFCGARDEVAVCIAIPSVERSSRHRYHGKRGEQQGITRLACPKQLLIQVFHALHVMYCTSRAKQTLLCRLGKRLLRFVQHPLSHSSLLLRLCRFWPLLCDAPLLESKP